MMSAPPTRSTDWMQATAAVVPLTVEQYHAMIRQGIIPESTQTELIDGFLVLKDRSKRGEDPMGIGSEHRWAVENLRIFSDRVHGWGMHVATQQPVTVQTMHEPEPDASFVVGPLDDYRTRTPTAAHVLCVCEVADSSLEYDRTTKQRLYATGGIPLYVIINLVDRVVELYADPNAATGRYARQQVISPGQPVEIDFGAGRRLTVPASELLP